MTFRTGPGARKRVEEPAGEARVEYRLVRDAIVRDVRKGRLALVDVCDAHPELMRAARNVGTAIGDECPICESEQTVQVTYVFGAGLPPGGRCPGTAAELARLRRRATPVTCFDVEVCPGCGWHHLLRKYPAGGRQKQKAAGSRR